MSKYLKFNWEECKFDIILMHVYSEWVCINVGFRYNLQNIFTKCVTVCGLIKHVFCLNVMCMGW